jgi:hypothetical protein
VPIYSLSPAHKVVYEGQSESNASLWSTTVPESQKGQFATPRRLHELLRSSLGLALAL